jgi:Tfp pilus assembly protein PilW
MINMALSVVIFSATIVFFFHCRRVNRKAEAGGWKPKA